MEAEWSSKTLVSYITTQCHNPEDHDLNKLNCFSFILSKIQQTVGNPFWQTLCIWSTVAYINVLCFCYWVCGNSDYSYKIYPCAYASCHEVVWKHKETFT